ncbi:TonB-dependent receptor [Pleionea sp. CnH1-48]|uniref:TonB-dependent receptor n=1 Tax=Pleionea sp. CnH1-48 TaxID=2954494 RepID=UPI002096F5A0|nr:TonB-dependent receptor [Pleionea sp. CnH1-48]MCO7227437.1 TonB-dependent receptor [Pleionea sp. CnH1-48]
MKAASFRDNNKTSLPTLKLLCSAVTAAIFSTYGYSAEDDKDKKADDSEYTKVVVTAQRREQNPQDVPIPLSVYFEGEMRELGAININDLGRFAPGLETNNASLTQPNYTIRGISTNDFGIGSDPAVAVYIDGVYVGRSGAAQLDFNDIERIEILKGPQGTLFGRNAAAGAIQVITKKPSKESEGHALVTLGNYNKRRIEAGFNRALGEDVYFRGSVFANQRDGYINNAITGEDIGYQDNYAAKGAVLWDLGNDNEVVWRFDYDNVDQDARPAASTNATIAPANPFGDYESDIDTMETREAWGTSVEVNLDRGGVIFTSLTSLRSFESVNFEEEDGSANNRFFFATTNQEEQTQFSQEFRLTSDNDSNVQWTLGSNFFWENVKQKHVVDISTNTLDTFFLIDGGIPAELIPAVPLGTGISGFLAQGFAQQFALLSQLTGLTTDQILAMTTQANLNRPWREVTENDGSFSGIAFFFDMNYAITDNLNLTAGLRYSHDRKVFTIDSQWRNEVIIPIDGVPPEPFGFIFFDQFNNYKQRDSWTDWTPRVVLDYKPNDNSMFYFSAAKGFKAGGFNSLGVDPAFEQENIFNYELGYKSDWLDNRLRFNFSVFRYDYDDLQILKLSGPSGSIPTYNVGNADAKGDGLEVEIDWSVTDNFRLSANYGHIKTEYTDYQLFPGETAADDLTGEPLSSMPEDKFNLQAHTTFDIGDSGSLDWRINYTYTGDRVDQSGADASQKIESYELINTRFTYRPADADWEISLWGANITDEEYLYSIGGQGSAVGSPVTVRAEPATYGLDFRWYF